MKILNENTFEIPARIEDFRRGPDLPRRGESKTQESSANPWLIIQNAARAIWGAKGTAAEKRNRVWDPPAAGLYIVPVSGPDDPR